MTTAILLLLVPLWPGLLALATLGLRHRRVGPLLTIAGPLPALGIGLAGPLSPDIDYPWLLLGTRFGLDEAGAVFLLFTAVIWLLAGIFSCTWIRERRAYFAAFFLLTMSGNLGVIVALDLPSFYACFALMSFAAYGLIAHSLTREAMHAANVYIVLVVVGEAALAAALILAAGAVGALDFESVRTGLGATPVRHLVIALAFVGFGIKAGVLILHVWLPLAHPVAPAPASAVLSGAVIVTGLIGWLRFLPVGEVALPGWGGACVVLGLAAAFYGALVGIDQRDPKVVLAYSSISQMGIMTVGVGMILLEPGLSTALGMAIAFFALHHGLAKSALFLGAGLLRVTGDEARRRRLVLGLALPSLALAGAPFTSGMVAKSALVAGEAALHDAWADVIRYLLPLTSIATALLMARFLALVAGDSVQEKSRIGPTPWYAWLASLLVALLLPWWVLPATQSSFTPSSLVASLWPLGIALAIAVIALRLWRRAGRPAIPEIPPGDVILPMESLVTSLRHLGPSVAARSRPVRTRWRRLAGLGHSRAWSLIRDSGRIESWLTRWPIALTLAVMVGVLVIVIAW